MAKETEPTIYSSTGREGVSRRQYNRLYVNGTHLAQDYGEVLGNFGRLTEIAARHPKKVTRAVYRGLVTERVLRKISAGPLQPNIEVAFPVGEFTGDGSHMIYLAQNHRDRKLLSEREVMIKNTEDYEKVKIPPRERVARVLNAGYTMTDRIGEDQIDQVYKLWEDTFGWSKKEVKHLRHRLLSDLARDPLERKLWFSAVESDGKIVSLAMAERLSMPAADGHLDLVESTEWKTHEKYLRQGFMSATLSDLNLRIISDLHDSPNGIPLIYAECNYQSRSDLAGHSVGFAIPDRNSTVQAPQILVQNVHIGDGQPLPDDSLRDFTFMYLSASIVSGWYNPD